MTCPLAPICSLSGAPRMVTSALKVMVDDWTGVFWLVLADPVSIRAAPRLALVVRLGAGRFASTVKLAVLMSVRRVLSTKTEDVDFAVLLALDVVSPPKAEPSGTGALDSASDTDEDVAGPLSESIVTLLVPVMLVWGSGPDPLPAHTLTLAE